MPRLFHVRTYVQFRLHTHSGHSASKDIARHYNFNSLEITNRFQFEIGLPPLIDQGNAGLLNDQLFKMLKVRLQLPTDTGTGKEKIEATAAEKTLLLVKKQAAEKNDMAFAQNTALMKTMADLVGTLVTVSQCNFTIDRR
ncbi:hypothetical protein CYMTET_52864 [Cymbomonas tetramitiformis]|uniref:Uncharacterized protein n=1 Tax=Cymbomonas tetramitiformis TaxID=36881 RepID=A0AAE0BJW1_9CHLO|nr:hypothetical protein CYMTET_52864 [Cymbomonas tetramitiformis]